MTTKLKKNLWFKEWFTPHETHSHRIKNYLVRKQTAFQKAVVADTYSFGRCLVLDGEMQSAELDEFIYHESLVHPVMTCHPNPKDILILGGGEGATVRELLKHNTVQRVTMVDIDGEVIDFCKKHLKSWHQGIFDDKRLRLVVDDAKKFIENTTEKFDVIISDLPSPIEAGPAYLLYTIEFYRVMVKRLKPGGLFVMQSGSGSLLQIELHQVLHSTLRKIFKTVRPYYTHIPSFDVPWAFIVASNSHDPFKMSVKATTDIIRKRMRGPLKFYDGITHTGLFHIPRHIREGLEGEKRVVTKARPIFFYK